MYILGFKIGLSSLQDRAGCVACVMCDILSTPVRPDTAPPTPPPDPNTGPVWNPAPCPLVQQPLTCHHNTWGDR